MDARERWQALQGRLTAARAAVDAGDREQALAEISAALELDKDFLAAHALRDRISSMDPGEAVVAPAAPTHPAPPHPAPSITSTETEAAPVMAKFEQRARRRRVDRRIDAARLAIEQQRLRAAAAALDEIIDLDPNVPELAELTARFDELRRAAATPRRGAWLAAAAVFAGAVLGGTWLQDSTAILSRQIVSAAPLPEPLTPTLAAIGSLAPVAADTTVAREHDTETAPALAAGPRVPEAATALSAAAAFRPAPRIDSAPVPTSVPEAIDAVSSVAPPAPATVAPAVVPASIRPTVEPPDDQLLVKQALQQYRKAYDTLDAQSAQAVWPAVNHAALARAFDGLESQALTFDGCDVRLRGDAATATCHGTARYVPKIGSRDPRVEPRVWNFTLRKADGDWKIDAARTER